MLLQRNVHSRQQHQKYQGQVTSFHVPILLEDPFQGILKQIQQKTASKVPPESQLPRDKDLSTFSTDVIESPQSLAQHFFLSQLIYQYDD